MKVKDLMTTKPRTLERNDALSVADDLVAEKRIRHFPVLEDGRLVGIVATRSPPRRAFVHNGVWIESKQGVPGICSRKRGYDGRSHHHFAVRRRCNRCQHDARERDRLSARRREQPSRGHHLGDRPAAPRGRTLSGQTNRHVSAPRIVCSKSCDSVGVPVRAPLTARQRAVRPDSIR